MRDGQAGLGRPPGGGGAGVGPGLWCCFSRDLNALRLDASANLGSSPYMEFLSGFLDLGRWLARHRTLETPKSVFMHQSLNPKPSNCTKHSTNQPINLRD